MAEREATKRVGLCINDHVDVLVEILKKLDGRSLAIAACVCRRWSSISRSDQLWENLCCHHVSPPLSGSRPVVEALGGYRRLYMVCIRPVLRRRNRVWTRDELQLCLSLFCVDYYDSLGDAASSSSSLMFLCMPVNV